MREFINTLRSRKWKILNKADIKMKKGSHRKQGQCKQRGGTPKGKNK